MNDDGGDTQMQGLVMEIEELKTRIYRLKVGGVGERREKRGRRKKEEGKEERKVCDCACVGVCLCLCRCGCVFCLPWCVLARAPAGFQMLGPNIWDLCCAVRRH